MLEKIQAGWETKKAVVSLLSLDVSGAFDNMSHPRLLHNLRKRRVGGAILGWIKSFLSNRKTILRVTDCSKKYSIQTGIPQSSAISPILYLFYNTDLIDLMNDPEKNILAVGWIDDITVLVAGPTGETNYETL